MRSQLLFLEGKQALELVHVLLKVRSQPSSASALIPARPVIFTSDTLTSSEPLEQAQLHWS